MEKEIEEIIKKNLPAQVGEILKERLEKADGDAAMVLYLQNRVVEQDKEIQTLNKRILEYEKFDVRNAQLDSKENELKEIERNLKIVTLEYQLQSEKEKTDFSKNIALGLVRNVEYRKTIFDSENQAPYIDAGGNWIYSTPVNKSLDETKKAE